MFLNDLSIYFIPVIGIVVLIIAVSSSRTIRLFKYQLSTKQRKHQSTTNNHTNETQNPPISVQVNPFSQLDHIDSNKQQTTTLSLDDDEELIKSDISSISASNFCENSSIELRLEQDLDYDNDLINENSN